MVPRAGAQTPPAQPPAVQQPPTFESTVDVVATPLDVAKSQTLAPVEAIASHELDQFVPGAAFAGAIRMLSTVMPTPGGVSIKGGRAGQAGIQLGTVTLVDPASGEARVVLPDDAIGSVTVLPNPYAVEYGRFASGLVVIESRRAGDQWKFHANRFGPSLRSTSSGGFRIDAYNPRVEIGGPIVKDRLFLEQTAQARYSIGDLASRPETDQRVIKALSTFTRIDANVTPRHLLVATVGIFPTATEFFNVSSFTPPDASVNFDVFGRQVALTERALWTNSTVSETTFQWYDSRTDVKPQGTQPMEAQPDITLGNYFNRTHRATRSYQFVHAVTAHRKGVGGSHVIKAGVDLLHTQYDGTSDSQAVLVERADATLARRLDFSGASVQAMSGTEVGLFAQDRVQAHARWYVEYGLRVDRDGVIGGANVSPRIGSAVLLNDSGTAVLRGGWGRFVERTPSMAGVFTSFERAVETRFAVDGRTPIAPAASVTHTVAPNLDTAASRTWDAAFDYRWNERWAFHIGAIGREGRHELIVSPAVTATGIERRLTSDGRSSYRDVELRAHYTRGSVVDVEATYTRSQSDGDLNALTKFYDTVLSPIVGDNAYTRLDTDIPHRLLVHGRVTPRPKWLLLGIFDWHTGVPYSVVNEMLDFTGPRNDSRFPAYARLELGIERRFKIFRFQPWVGVRVGNVLRAYLPDEVQNNTGSPNFGTFYNAEPRRARVNVRFER